VTSHILLLAVVKLPGNSLWIPTRSLYAFTLHRIWLPSGKEAVNTDRFMHHLWSPTNLIGHRGQKKMWWD